jgi:PAS domain S-box-containing protein
MAENLREREELTHSILDTAYDAFIAIDAAGLIIDWNRQAEVIFGWAHDEIIGKPLVETVIPPKHREDHKRGLQHFLASGEGPVLNQRIELAALRRNGEEFPVEITIWPLRVGQTHRFNALLHDITEHKKTEQEMKRYRERLESANKELEAFSYSVSHDLRAPLRAIDGFSRILMEDYLPQLAPESHRYLRRVRENAQQMGHLIDDLLNFSRLSRHPLRLQPVKPSDLFRQALQDLRQEQDGRRVDIAIGDLPQCRADPVLLKQVFVNLLSNALKFTRQREFSRIEVGWRDANGNPVYFVKDNGAGFDMRYGDKLFGVFQRFHKAEEYEGTGVGLAIAQRVIQRHGGSIWAEARVNQGATFFFTLKGGRPHE